MEGWIATIFFVAGLTDMYYDDCRTACLGEAVAQDRVTLQAAVTEFQHAFTGTEVMLGYDLPVTYGPFQPTLAVSQTSKGDMWMGFGAKWIVDDVATGPFFYEAAVIPGLYLQGEGPDLGYPLQFRASVGVGYEFKSGITMLLAYDHRSHGNIKQLNPGLETISIRFAIPLD